MEIMPGKISSTGWIVANKKLVTYISYVLDSFFFSHLGKQVSMKIKYITAQILMTRLISHCFHLKNVVDTSGISKSHVT